MAGGALNLDLAGFRAAAARGNLVPLYREILADGDTPVSAYAKLGGRPGSFLLESVVGGEKWAAYSFIGVTAQATFRARGGRFRVTRARPRPGEPAVEEGEAEGGDASRALERLLAGYRVVVPPGLPRFFGGAVGWFAYDAVRALERLPSRAADPLGLPDAAFVVTETLLVFDNLRQTVKVVSCARVDGEGDAERAYAEACAQIDEAVAALRRPFALPVLDVVDPVPSPDARSDDAPLPATITRAQFEAAVARAKEYILAGDVFQVVLSQRFTVPRPPGYDPFRAYRALRVVNPSPYMFHLAFDEAQVTGASPEVLVRVEDGRVEVRPLAGTRPRGQGPEEDARLEAELAADDKERAEHLMLIDLGRNDVGRVAEVGSVRVHAPFSVERYSHVMHLVSGVSGRLAPGRTALDAFRAAFPAGTLTGAPKIRAMEIIEELEPSRRGVYGGAVGYVSFTGNLDLAIAIRAVVVKDDLIHVQAGAGIVADSRPEAEYEETLHKARAVARALRAAGC
jgi:anthranilate synthase component 1